MRWNIRLRSLWVLWPVWSRSRQSWIVLELETLSVEERKRIFKNKCLSKQDWQTMAGDGIMSSTYKFIIFLWYQDVHLRAVSTNDVTVEGFPAQVDLAALGLVDRNCGNFSQNLQQNIRKVWVRTHPQPPGTTVLNLILEFILTCSWTAFEFIISTIPTTFSNTSPSFLQLSTRRERSEGISDSGIMPS